MIRSLCLTRDNTIATNKSMECILNIKLQKRSERQFTSHFWIISISNLLVLMFFFKKMFISIISRHWDHAGSWHPPIHSSTHPSIDKIKGTLRWRHNGPDSVSNHQPHDCLLNRLFSRRPKKTLKLRVTGLCAGNSPGTGEFPTQMASNAENVSIWLRHYENRRVKPAQYPSFCRCKEIQEYQQPHYWSAFEFENYTFKITIVFSTWRMSWIHRKYSTALE